MRLQKYELAKRNSTWIKAGKLEPLTIKFFDNELYSNFYYYIDVK